MGIPGEGAGDRSCAAVAYGGAGTETDNYAGMGLILADGAPYDASSYSGIRVRIESDFDVELRIKTVGPLYYAAVLEGGTVGQSVLRQAAFASMTPLNPAAAPLDLTEVIEIQFEPVSVLGYGYSVHLVEFY